MNLLPTLLLLCCLLSGPTAAAQSLLQQLAEEVCACMTSGEIVYPRLQAGRCVEDVAKAHPQRIQDELQLSVMLADDQRRLGELLVDPLTEHCTALLTPRRTDPEITPELKYSDFSLARAASRPAIAKSPPADPPRATVRDAPRYLQATGEVLDVERDVMRVMLDSGRLLNLRCQSRQLRRNTPRTGQRVQLTYTENWTADDRQVTYDLLEMN